MTWEDLQLESMNCPVLHQAVTLANRGDLTREQALIEAAIWLSRERLARLKRDANRLMREPSRIVNAVLDAPTTAQADAVVRELLADTGEAPTPDKLCMLQTDVETKHDQHFYAGGTERDRGCAEAYRYVLDRIAALSVADTGEAPTEQYEAEKALALRIAQKIHGSTSGDSQVEAIYDALLAFPDETDLVKILALPSRAKADTGEATPAPPEEKA